MDAALKRHPLLVTALAPLIPHLVGSAFNIWYNMTVIDPLLVAAGFKKRFIDAVLFLDLVDPVASSGVSKTLPRSKRFRGRSRSRSPTSGSLAVVRRSDLGIRVA